MQKPNSEHGPVLLDLGDGLILRRATPEDSEALVAFNSWIHGNLETEKPDERVGVWTRDLMERPHPTFKVGDFTLVEDTKTGAIVSSLNLISQTWSYGGIPFGVGRPELVGTHPDYRERGLVRAQFEVVHRWSAERGELVQAITGIPYYYRLFGYEMGLELGGGRVGFKSHIPKLAEDKEEPYRIRPALEKDLPFIMDLFRQGSKRYLVQCIWDEALWRYELNGKSPQNVNRSELRIIETTGGEPAGFLAHPTFTWGPSMVVTMYELVPGLSWGAVTPTVIRYLQATGESYVEEKGEKVEFGAFGFWLGSEHPVYHVIPDKLPRVRKPYAWYVRVPDLAEFIRHIGPVLEKRLAGSPMVGHSGELKLTFYRHGLRLVFENGRLAESVPWNPVPQRGSGDAAFPELTFLQLLFGYRSLDELKYAFVDCWTEHDDATALLNALFPRHPSSVWPVA
jgi:hypothetical protein